MKIAHLIHSFLPASGGAEICIHNVAASQAALGHEVSVVTHARDDGHARGRSFGYRKVVVPRPPLYWNFSLARLYVEYFLNSLQRKYNFDLWQVTMGYPLGAASVRYFNRHRIPCVLRCCGDDIQIDREISYGIRLRPAIDRVIRKTYPCFDAFIANSRSMFTEYLRLGIPAEKITLIPNGVDNARFKLAEAGRKNGVGLKGIDPARRTILSVGRNHPKKGYELIPLILRELLQKGCEVQWIVIGKGSGRIKDLAVRSGVADRITLIEGIHKDPASPAEVPPAQLLDYYAGSDIFVLPTYIEGYPTVILEALAAGLPVVTSNVPGCRDIIKDGENGLLLPKGDVAAFSEAILELFADRNLLNTLHRNGKKLVEEQDWSRIAQRYLNVYKTVYGKYRSTAEPGLGAEG